MKWIGLVVLALAALAALAAFVGSRVPVAHVASRRARFEAAPETVWAAITAVEDFPAWRKVDRVERLPDRGGRPAWIEHTSDGRITLVADRHEPPRLLVVRIDDPDLPFGGTWTYEIEPSQGGCTLTITENGEIYNPFFRVMARYVFGYEGTMTEYLEALGRHVRATREARAAGR